MLTMQLKNVAQVQNNPPMREVLGTGGTSGVLPWGTIDFSIGEPIIWTYAPSTAPLTIKALTQGFEQPNSTANSFLDASVIYAPSSCIGANNGSASLNILSSSFKDKVFMAYVFIKVYTFSIYSK